MRFVYRICKVAKAGLAKPLKITRSLPDKNSLRCSCALLIGLIDEEAFVDIDELQQRMQASTSNSPVLVPRAVSSLLVNEAFVDYLNVSFKVTLQQKVGATERFSKRRSAIRGHPLPDHRAMSGKTTRLSCSRAQPKNSKNMMERKHKPLCPENQYVVEDIRDGHTG